MFADSSLPPLSPLPHCESSPAPNKVLMEELDISSFPWETSFHGGNSLPPRRGHRRSNSDLPLGCVSSMFQSSLQFVQTSNRGSFGKMGDLGEIFGDEKFMEVNKQGMDVDSFGKSSGVEFFDGTTGGDSADEFFNSLINMDNANASSLTGEQDFDNNVATNNAKLCRGDAEEKSSSANLLRRGISPAEGIKRSASEDIAPPVRHRRSLSVDSAMIKYDFDKLDHLSPSNTAIDNSCNVNLDFGNGGFNDLELTRINKDEKLAEIAASDPKRAKRILANRQSAARSKERKNRYISELELKVQKLQTEATTISAQVTILQKEYADLTRQNSELRFRFQATEQQAKLRDALHSALTAEVQRLKLGNLELRDDRRMANGLVEQIALKQQHGQMQ